jgi:RNA polymerase sigma-70 factor (ECF subfamily)
MRPPDDVPSASPAVHAALTEGYERLRGFLRTQFRDEHEAEEVLHAFCLRALEKAKYLRDTRAVRSWLSRVLATTVTDFRRRQGAHRRRHSAGALEDLPAAAERIDHGQALAAAVCACIEGLLSALSADDAHVITRLDLRGESRRSVAHELGLSVNALTVRLHRARRAVRALILRLCTACARHGFAPCDCKDKAAERVPGHLPVAAGAGDQ